MKSAEVNSMRTVTETFADHKIYIRSKNPYIFALEFMDMARNLGRIVEKENEILAEGVENIVKVEFDVVKVIDKNIKVVVDVSLEGDFDKDGGKLAINMHGFLKMVFRNSEGIMDETFGEFYHKNLVPELRKASKNKAKDMIRILKDNAKELQDKESA